MLIPLFYFFCIASIHLAYKSTKRLRCLKWQGRVGKWYGECCGRIMFVICCNFLSTEFLSLSTSIMISRAAIYRRHASVSWISARQRTIQWQPLANGPLQIFSEIFLPCLFMLCTRKIPVTSHVTNTTQWQQGELSIVLSFQLLKPKQTLCRIITLGFMG